METSKDFATRQILKTLGHEKLLELSDFASTVNYNKILSKPLSKDYFDKAHQSLTLGDADILRRYSGYEYSKINGVLRGFWNYETMGMQTDTETSKLKKYANLLSLTIREKGKKLPHQTTVYRGTNLAAFRSFGVTSLEELKFLVGEFVYEQGFLSTSLSKDSCFFNRELEHHDVCNVQIVYTLPKGTSEIMPLVLPETSYSPNQKELLIDKGSLSKIIDVEINGNTATLTAVLIPKAMWELEPPTHEKTN